MKIQPQFKADLLEKVVVFREASSNYMSDYSEVCISTDKHLKILFDEFFFFFFSVSLLSLMPRAYGFQIGPMVSGISPQEASDRLNTFQVMVLMKCVKEQLREVLQAY